MKTAHTSPATPALERLARWIRTHGVVADVCGESIRIEIEWTGRNGERGIEIKRPSTRQRARAVLGY